jgi:hypothetical protein
LVLLCPVRPAFSSSNHYCPALSCTVLHCYHCPVLSCAEMFFLHCPAPWMKLTWESSTSRIGGAGPQLNGIKIIFWHPYL